MYMAGFTRSAEKHNPVSMNTIRKRFIESTHLGNCESAPRLDESQRFSRTHGKTPGIICQSPLPVPTSAVGGECTDHGAPSRHRAAKPQRRDDCAQKGQISQPDKH